MSNVRALTFSFLFLSVSFLAPQVSASAADLGSGPDSTPAALLKKSYDQMIEGDFRDAVDTQILAVKADKNSVSARRYLSYSLLKIGASDEAIEQLNNLLTMTKATPVDMLMCGEACLQTGKLRDSAQWFKDALSADPKLAYARVGLAKVAAAKKKVASAIKESESQLDAEVSEEPKTTFELGLIKSEDGVIAYSVKTAGNQETQSYASETARMLRYAAKNQQVASAQPVGGTQSQGNNQVINAWAGFKGIQKRY